MILRRPAPDRPGSLAGDGPNRIGSPVASDYRRRIALASRPNANPEPISPEESGLARARTIPATPVMTHPRQATLVTLDATMTDWFGVWDSFAMMTLHIRETGSPGIRRHGRAAARYGGTERGQHGTAGEAFVEAAFRGIPSALPSRYNEQACYAGVAAAAPLC
jgi:hypothetical protein